MHYLLCLLVVFAMIALLPGLTSGSSSSSGAGGRFELAVAIALIILLSSLP